MIFHSYVSHYLEGMLYPHGQRKERLARRRFEGCQDDACKLALYIAEARAAWPKASDGYWQCPSIAHGMRVGMAGDVDSF